MSSPAIWRGLACTLSPGMPSAVAARRACHLLLWPASCTLPHGALPSAWQPALISSCATPGLSLPAAALVSSLRRKEAGRDLRHLARTSLFLRSTTPLSLPQRRSRPQHSYARARGGSAHRRAALTLAPSPVSRHAAPVLYQAERRVKTARHNIARDGAPACWRDTHALPALR